MDSLLLWDVESHPIDDYDTLIYWSSFSNAKEDKIFSIPLLVEKSAESLRSKYLKLIYEFGEARVHNQSIIEYLQIRQNFSYWWMTLLVEKCNYSKSPQIDNIIKLMALEQWLQENKYHEIKIVTANKALADAVILLAKKLSIDFEWEKSIDSKNSSNLIKRIYHSLPNIIQSPIWLLRYALLNWPLKGARVKEWRETTATTTFVSYLDNLVPESAINGRYESRYWTKLTDVLGSHKHPTNWLHIYVKDGLLPSAKKARTLIQEINNRESGKQTHVTLASFLSISLLLQTLKDWYKVQKLKKTVCKQVQLKSDYLWPLFEKDCQDSMSGIAAISNLQYFNLFERAMNELPVQKKGCYLQENQGWEFGFISSWRGAGHGKNLVGFPHSTVRYWDLRYFFDSRSYVSTCENNLPLPDYVGINGSISKNSYIDGGYPQEGLIEIEALRYLYLKNSCVSQIKNNKNRLQKKSLLVVGDYLKENTNKQLALLMTAFESIDQSVRYIIKPHPNCPINMQDLPGLNCEISTQPIDELLLMSDIVYSSAVTSAAVDAYCTGKPVITILDGKSLNMSPLRGVSGVHFVSNAKELAIAINGAEMSELEQREDYFYLDPELPRWRSLLGIGVQYSE
jgi:surface carbohydrate biosynthesis protein (TIGR04326 family)